MNTNQFFHALTLDENRCIGCSHCVSVCPTEALRIREGRAKLIQNRCVDCGECAEVCPTQAICITYDGFESILNYEYRVALVPSIFIAQFPDEVGVETIYNAILKMGFTHIYESENGVTVLEDELVNYQRKHKDIKPLISSFCPAVVRLVQVRFPSLVSNLVLQKTPMDISALFVEKQLIDKGAKKEDIGIFYITPCAAKIVAIQDPVGDEKSPITGSINMNVFYNKVYGMIKRKEVDNTNAPAIRKLSKRAITYSLTNGEKAIAEGNCMAVDEIHNVIAFLDKVENEEVSGVDFLELKACDQGCVGGVLTMRNKFLASHKMRKILPVGNNCTLEKSEVEFDPIEKEYAFLKEYIPLQRVEPRSMLKLGESIEEALTKIDKMNSIVEKLPRVDCTLCGAPNCQALALDIVEGKSELEHCIFMQKMLEEKGKLTSKQSAKKFYEVWGRVNRNINKSKEN